MASYGRKADAASIRRAREDALTVPERHRLKVARDTLKMPDAIAGVMGGPSKAEARETVAAYDPKWKGYERERCEDCGRWIPWPALEDHECKRRCICWELGATGYGQTHTRCPADHFRAPERPR